jgi:3-mercaptopyruvate sulfurtransferase SseA
MTKRKLASLLVLFTLAISACVPSTQSAPTVIVELTSPPVDTLPQTEADVPRVTVEEALSALNSGAAIIVDVRSTESFADGHIAGAISIPLSQIEANPAGVDLSKAQWIITYCT